MKVGKSIATVGTFGAALTAMGIAPELEAAIVNLSFAPGTNPYNPGPTTFLIPINIVEIGGTVDFSQWNDFIGRTMVLGGSISQAGVVPGASVSISPATFFPGSSNIVFTTAQTGTAYVGFRIGANVGWFAMNFGGVGGPITYLGGQFGDAGETLHIPAPAALALLALGAVGVRRNRKRVA